MNEIETQLDELRVPRDAQNWTLPDLSGGGRLRGYIESLNQERDETGINFIFANVCNDFEASMTVSEARFILWVFAKELVLARRRPRLINATTLARIVSRAESSDEAAELDRADHLILTNFFTVGQPCPFQPWEVAKLTEYIIDRYEHGGTTHTFWRIHDEQEMLTETSEWYPRVWVEELMEVNEHYWIRKN